jgi:hypothetical protein
VPQAPRKQAWDGIDPLRGADGDPGDPRALVGATIRPGFFLLSLRLPWMPPHTAPGMMVPSSGGAPAPAGERHFASNGTHPSRSCNRGAHHKQRLPW